MNSFKKNQLSVLVITLMLITAGYLNYDARINGKTKETSSNAIDIAAIGDATFVNVEVSDENVINTSNNEITKNNDIEKGDDSNNYFIASKLERDVMYSQMIERYQEILDSSKGDSDQKVIAEQEINELNKLQNAIMISENLLKTKGFEENIIFVNGESISVIIGKAELNQDEISQIQNIISRELNADVENIHISIK